MKIIKHQPEPPERAEMSEYFQYSEKDIRAMMDRFRADSMERVAMRGTMSDLEYLKEKLETLYDTRVFHLNDFSDAPFFGWSKEELDKMRLVTNSIIDRIHEIYALILVGMGDV